MLESLTRYFWPANDTDQAAAPEGLCPNCWGEQEYDGAFRKGLSDKQIDVKNGRAKNAFIQDFIIQNVDGIRLKNQPEGATCPRCKHVHTR
ncbi:MAG: hypothetical protein ACI9VR_001055 [Cognaticolwellia sp.]|jgi:hypothetical protein